MLMLTWLTRHDHKAPCYKITKNIFYKLINAHVKSELE